MLEMPFLRDLLIVMGASVVAVAALRRTNLPAPLGFMLVGILVGPNAFKLISSMHDVEILAEIGVALLLFTIGLHFSLREILSMGRLVWGGGTAQVGITMLLVAGCALLLGSPMESAWLYGGLVALSSTAIVLRILQEQGASSSPSGRLIIGILLLQDLAIVPLMLMVPLLGSDQNEGSAAIFLTLGKALGMIGLIIVLARTVFPWILDRVVGVRSGELFTLTTLFLALGTAELAHAAGLSLALGAFIAGVVLADTEYSHQIMGEIAPFRDAFTGLFFVSVGMLLDPRVWVESPGMLLGFAVGIVLLKAIVTGGTAMVLGLGARVAIIAGLGLAQIGEFSFLLGQSGLAAGLLTETQYSHFIAITILLMGIAPFMIQSAPALADRLLNRNPRHASEPYAEELEGQSEEHVIVVGYGVNGRNVARVLRDMEIPMRIIELNTQLVRQARLELMPVMWGDAARRAVLEHADITKARAIVIAIADPAASRQITALAHEMHPKMLVLVRTRYVREMEELYRLGADEVVPEEIETSLELAARVMRTYGAGEWAILRTQSELRQDHYRFLLDQKRNNAPVLSPLLRLLAMEEAQELYISPLHHAVGQTLRDLDLPNRTGVTVLACLRDEESDMVTPGPDTMLEAGMTLLLLGRGPALDTAIAYLKTGKAPPDAADHAHPRTSGDPPGNDASRNRTAAAPGEA